MEDGLSEKISMGEEDLSSAAREVATRAMLSHDVSSSTAEEREVLKDLIDILISARGGPPKFNSPESSPSENRISVLARKLSRSPTWHRLGVAINRWAAAEPTEPTHAELASDIEQLTAGEREVVRGMMEILIRARSEAS
jgi:hypothetical protein